MRVHSSIDILRGPFLKRYASWIHIFSAPCHLSTETLRGPYLKWYASWLRTFSAHQEAIFSDCTKSWRNESPMSALFWAFAPGILFRPFVRSRCVSDQWTISRACSRMAARQCCAQSCHWGCLPLFLACSELVGGCSSAKFLQICPEAAKAGVPSRAVVPEQLPMRCGKDMFSSDAGWWQGRFLKRSLSMAGYWSSPFEQRSQFQSVINAASRHAQVGPIWADEGMGIFLSGLCARAGPCADHFRKGRSFGVSSMQPVTS